LPKELAELARRQAVDIRDEAFHSDVDLLLQLLRGERPATPRPRGRLLAAGVAILAAVGGTAAWLVLNQPDDANWRALDQGGWEIVLTTAMKNRNSINRQHTQDYYANIVVAERPFDPTCFDTPREEYTAPEQVADGHVGFAVSCPPDGSMDLELKAQPSGDRTPLRLTAATTPGDCLTDSP
jgi:hypothetical protein